MSLFGIGFLPKGPGTWASAATLPLLYFMGQLNVPVFIFIPFIVITTTASCFIAEYTQKKFGLHDPGWIVMDEVLGMLVAWLFITERPVSLTSLLIIFVLFRIFDIFKVFPATYFDKLEHGSGTILDDIISGIFAGLIFLAYTHFTA